VNRLVRNTGPFRFVFAAVVFLASSGATLAFRQCSMENSSCCSASSCDNEDPCSQATASSSDHTIKAEFACHTIMLVGGVAIQPAVMEQGHKQQLNKVVAACSLQSSCTLSVQPNHPSYPQLVVRAAPPPAVEKYALNSAYLI
jgi:hypothetical protein